MFGDDHVRTVWLVAAGAISIGAVSVCVPDELASRRGQACVLVRIWHVPEWHLLDVHFNRCIRQGARLDCASINARIRAAHVNVPVAYRLAH